MTNFPPTFILTTENKLESALILTESIMRETYEQHTKAWAANIQRLLKEVITEMKERKNER